MKENFKKCFDLTMKWEGGSKYIDNPKDPGGPTKWGVDIATLSHELGKQATPLQVFNLTEDDAAQIAQKRYWNAIGGDALPSGVDMICFDVAYNSGAGRALQFLHDTHYAKTTVDRIKTIDMLRKSFWQHLKIWVTFGRGWSRREADILQNSLKLAKPEEPTHG